MPQSRKRLFFILVFSLGCAGARAQTESLECRSLTSRIFAATGVDDFISAMPMGVQQGAAASLANTKASPADLQRFQGALLSAFASAKVSRVIRAEFLKSCDAPALRAAISDMSDPVAVRMVRLEAATQNPEIQAQMQGYIATLAQHPPTAERVRLIQRLDVSTGSTELLDDAITLTARTMLALTGRPEAAESAQAQIPKAALDSLHNMVIATLLFTYRDVGDPELSQYAAVWERPAMRSFTYALGQAFLNTMKTQMVEFWNDVTRPIPTSASRSRP